MTSAGGGEFPPHVLREYALIADGNRGALCGPRGDIVWMCAPRWDSAGVFSTLIGGDGVYAVTPVETFVWGGHYEPGTLIWRNRWVTSAGGVIECRDALQYPSEEGRLVLLRSIDAVSGDARVRVVLDARAAFGKRAMREVRRDSDGTWTARTGNLALRWSGAPDAVRDGDGALATVLTVPAGGSHHLVLEIGEHRLGDRPEPTAAWHATEESWRRAVPTFPAAAAPRSARHSYAVLRGLTRPGGGMVAAVTLGLPERSDAGRNYDYRYVWIRDQAYAGMAAAVDDPHPLLDDAAAFATAQLLEHGDDIAPAYRIDGSPLPSERRLSLSGYPGGRDVVGNWVNGQFQLDAIGESLSLFAAAARHDHLETDAVRAVRVAIDIVQKRWQAPDAGIWELDDDWWTQSRLACVAGLRSIAEHLPAADTARPLALADAILAETSKRCLHPSGYWRRRPADDGTDASLVLCPVRGALPADDPRTIRTIEQVERTLTDDGYVYRFAADGQELGSSEGAFVMCGFVMALAHCHQGNTTAAFRWFERNRGASGSPGLFAEEYDVRQRQLRGNLPQAFVHAVELEANQRLASLPDASGSDALQQSSDRAPA
jgi:GH15 family glucan-1,4-alpha-glucosidase